MTTPRLVILPALALFLGSALPAAAEPFLFHVDARLNLVDDRVNPPGFVDPPLPARLAVVVDNGSSTAALQSYVTADYVYAVLEGDFLAPQPRSTECEVRSHRPQERTFADAQEETGR